MYLWKIDQLKKDLKKGPLSEKESFLYLIFSCVLLMILIFPSGVDINHWDQMSYALGIIMTALGIWYVYKRNGGDSGVRFLDRYVSLGWVVLIRSCVFILLPMMFLYIVFLAGTVDMDSPAALETTGYDVLLEFLFVSLYYWIFGKHMDDVATLEDVADVNK